MTIHLPKRRRLVAADLFCGAGGTTTGAVMAADKNGFTLDLLGVNHWYVACNTHALNHPELRDPVQASIEDVRPETHFKMGQLDHLFASPECTHFSNARGAAPIDDQRRCGARRVTDWAERLKPKRIWVENVKEFLDWAPLICVKGRWIPDPKHKGALFRNWVRDLETLGYRVGWKLQVCANFGAPTTRCRLIVQAALKPLQLVWPAATHESPSTTTESGLPQWIATRDIIEWERPCQSIFERDKPLSDNTLRRIEAGLRAQGIEAFLVQYAHGDSGSRRWRALSETFSTVTCSDEWLLVKPFICELHGSSKSHLKSTARPLSETLGTVCAGGTHHLLAKPFLLQYNGTATYVGIDEPMPTVTTRDRFALARPEIYTTDGRKAILDIGTRMLADTELARAQSFPEWYRFTGTKKERVKQIGNAVPPKLAESHYSAALQIERRAA